jgi:hypothetical protein
MPSDPYRKVHPGEPLSIGASAYNAFVDAAKAIAQGRMAGGAGDLSDPRAIVFAKVRNDSGQDVDRFSIMKINSFLIGPGANQDEFLARPMFGVTVPTSPVQDNAHVITIEPIKNGEMGTAAIAGAVPVQLIGTGGTIYSYAEPIAGDVTKVKSVPHGPLRLLWYSAGWAVVTFDAGDREAVVYVTSNVPDSNGYYDAVVQRYESGGWVSLYSCKAVDMNR